MIDLIDRNQIRRLVTHDGCMDGLASAMLVRERLPDLPITFVQYGTPEHRELLVEPGLVFCDMTPPRERVQEFVAAGAWCLDHHKHARDLVEAFGARGVFADEETEPGVSGAVLAYRYFSESTVETWRPEHFARLAGIRDTWQSADPSWLEALQLHAVLQHYPQEYWLGLPHAAIGLALAETRQLGAMLLAKKALKVQEILEKGMVASEASEASGVRWGLTAAPPELTSDLAEAARQLETPVAVLVNCMLSIQEGAPGLIFSLRSDGSVDVGALAKFFGGGGHSRAAAFRTTDFHGGPLSWFGLLQRAALSRAL